jgi:hypothetical protein
MSLVCVLSLTEELLLAWQRVRFSKLWWRLIGVLSVPYQGNAWWTLFGMGSLLMLCHVLSRILKRRQDGLPVDVENVVAGCVLPLFFLLISIYQVLSHQ